MLEFKMMSPSRLEAQKWTRSSSSGGTLRKKRSSLPTKFSSYETHQDGVEFFLAQILKHIFSCKALSLFLI